MNNKRTGFNFEEAVRKNPTLKPNYFAYFLPLMMLGAGLIWLEPLTIPLVQLALIMALRSLNRIYDRRIIAFTKYVTEMTENVNKENHYAVDYMQVGICTLDYDGHVMWHNEKFKEIVGRSDIERSSIDALLPLPARFLDNTWHQGQTIHTIRLSDKIYTLQARRVDSKQGEEIRELADYSLYLYDVTELTNLKREYTESRLAICMVRCDNYDDVVRDLSEEDKGNFIGNLNREFNRWAESHHGFIVHSGNGGAVIGFMHKDFSEIFNNKFQILKSVHNISTAGRMSPTLSIGVAMAGNDLDEQMEKAVAAFDMALNRGGDQVVVNNNEKFHYFGATGAVYTKSNRVRARVVAQGLREQMEQAENVIVMGHRAEDYDALGAAAGVVAMAKSLKKPVYVAVSSYFGEYQRSREIFNKYFGDENHDSICLNREDDLEKLIKDSTLLILVDHHKKTMSAIPDLVDKIKHRILIDHHRRSEDIIPDLLVVYQEPSSSSTCEMVTELMHYFNEEMDLTEYEATKLYLGIVLDSKNFTLQTSERTFDAAALLQHFGANIQLVNEIFAETLDEIKYRSKLLSQAKIIAPDFYLAVAESKEKSNRMNILAGKVADELIQTNEVSGACVLTRYEDGEIKLNARSDGKVYNVQVIMEAFGGGGHQNMAAAQINDKSIEEATGLLLEEIKKQVKE